MKRCHGIILCAVLASCIGTYVGLRLTGTHDMTIDEAMRLVGHDLTGQQRKLVAAALRRQGLALVRQLVEMAKLDDAAGVEARAAILQLRDALK